MQAKSILLVLILVFATVTSGNCFEIPGAPPVQYTPVKLKNGIKLVFPQNWTVADADEIEKNAFHEGMGDLLFAVRNIYVGQKPIYAPKSDAYESERKILRHERYENILHSFFVYRSKETGKLPDLEDYEVLKHFIKAYKDDCRILDSRDGTKTEMNDVKVSKSMYGGMPGVLFERKYITKDISTRYEYRITIPDKTGTTIIICTNFETVPNSKELMHMLKTMTIGKSSGKPNAKGKK